MISGTLAFIIILLIFSVYVAPAYAETSTQTPLDIVIEEIKGWADNHVKYGNSMQTQLIVNLYSNNTVGLTPKEIAQIYEEEFIRLKTLEIKVQTQPSGLQGRDFGLGVIGTLAFLLIFYLLRDWLSKFFKSVGSWIYNRLAGSRFFRRIALRHYKKALIGKYEKLHIPFRPDRPLDMHEVYVPLKLEGSTSNEKIDLCSSITDHRKLVVIGPPGSGKSMLLKHIALDYAEDRFIELDNRPILILLELHRLNGNTMSLEQHLVAELARNDFPHAERFISHSLKEGTLMLLFDGLDEVNSSERGRVIQQIKDILDEHRKCRAAITCRTVIYKGEFSETVDKTLEIVEFSDQQIRSFLSSWAPDMPADKSIEQLMQTLRDRPRIMALARNPLLLTIIAYLYTDTTYLLPHSRAEFYRQSTDVLLRQWHQERNRFEARDKRLVLEHLGLFFQDSSNQDQQDRRSMNYQTVLDQVRNVLPGLNLRPEQDACPILNEIVERSGLLLSIDGGERYQFAHLTLQEFFAASELMDDADGIVARFQGDHDTWRETVKLWCGLTGDSTALIRKVYAEDPITAFECISDAQKVDPILADEIIETFKSRLGVGSDEDVITQAFGTVASDSRPRGASVFKFLEETLIKEEEIARKASAAKALSLTNLPQAAKVLADNYKIPEARNSLVHMGDLAVPALRSLAYAGSMDAFDDLHTIGTPQAAQALVPSLWHRGEAQRARSAWLLAALLPKPNMESTLRNYTFSEGQRRADLIDWIWQPFEEPTDSALPVIAGRIAYILDHAPIETAPEIQLALDPRIVIPLCSIQHSDEISKIKINFSITDQEPFFLRENIKKVLDNKINNPSLRYLLNSLTNKQLLLLFQRLENGPIPTTDDWLNIFRPLKYEFYKSWHYRIILILTIVASIAIFGQALYLTLANKMVGFGLISLILATMAIFFRTDYYQNPIFSQIKSHNIQFNEEIKYCYMKKNLESIKSHQKDILDYFHSRENYISSIEKYADFTWEPKPTDYNRISNFARYLFLIDSFSYNLYFRTMQKVIMYNSIIGFYSIIIALFTLTLPISLAWYYIALLWLTLIGTCSMLWLIGKRRERKAQNPLHGLIVPNFEKYEAITAAVEAYIRSAKQMKLP